MKTALTIAGSDPTGGAGLQADLKVFRAFHVHGTSVVTAVTAQNTRSVDSFLPVSRECVEQQLRVLLQDITPDAVKTGMLYSIWAAELVANMFRGYSLKNLVIDPVTVSSTGISLIEDGILDGIKEKLFPVARIITPNIYEASLLSGVSIEDRKDMETAARILLDTGVESVVITGGHLEDIALDLFYDGTLYALEGSKMKGMYHGTGCAFSAAITALLAQGSSTLEAVMGAKEFITGAIQGAYYPGKGMGILKL
jgi:hydroxymethylpyrimidine/phosphomethylpyrimidine kinase